MLKELLFETRAGAWALSQFERRCDLAVVGASWLGAQTSGLAADQDGDQASDSGQTPVIVFNFNTTDGSQQAEADRVRGLLVGFGLYPAFDTGQEDPGGLVDTLVAMVRQLDQNDQLSLWILCSHWYRTVPTAEWWQSRHVEILEDGATC